MSEKTPKGWKKVKLWEVAELSKNIWKCGNEKLPYIGLEHIEKNKLRLNNIGTSDEVASDKFVFTENEFLFGKLRPYFRKLYRPKFKGICSTDIWVVKPKNDVNKDFLFYVFANQEFVDLAYKGSSGTRMPRAEWNYMKETEWLIPEKKTEQKAIASVLSSLDDKIDLLHRQNQTLEKMAETLFRQWFIEEAKDDWEEVMLGNVVNIKYGKNLPTSRLSEQGYPVFGGNGQIGFYKEYMYEKPQVLISCRGAASGKVIISSPYSFITNNSLILEIPEGSILNFEFLKYYAFITDFSMYVSGSAQPQITINGLSNAELILPPDKNLIEKFSEMVKPIEQKILNNKQQIRTLEQLRDILLPKLMSREVRVKI